MAHIHGNELGIYIDSVADGATQTLGPSNYQLIACSTSCSINVSNSVIETACKSDTLGDLDDASTRYTVAGQQSWTMSVDGLVDLTADGATGNTTGFADLMDLAMNRTPVYVCFSTGEAETEFWGEAFISSIDATAGVDDFTTYSVSMEGSGDLTARTGAF